MRILRALDDPRSVGNIPFRSEDRISPVFKDNTDMIMFPVFKNPVIQNDVTGIRNKAFAALMIPNPGIAHGKFIPGDAACQMAGFACFRPDGDIKSRFPAAIIDKCRAP